tara:strand:- start:2056 stop:2325 length:270 start_codon:yes stop_codon:yes gene_type:complete
MKYIDNDTRFTARASSLYGASRLFESKEEFEKHIEEKRNTPGRKYKLWDENPESFPCLMLEIGEMYNPDGADWTLNTFLYDVEIHDDEE